jgi:hypothetical protein
VKPLASPSSRVSLLAAAVAALLGAAACYSPKISPGGFACSKTYMQECPSGYSCRADNHCWLNGTNPPADAGVDHAVDQAVDTTVEAAAEVHPPDAMIEVQPTCIVKPSPCTPAGGATCDPMCSTGCPVCDQKCSVNTLGTATCNAPLAGLVRQLGESCTVDKAGSAGQTDNCAAGLLCIQASCGSSCFKFCRVDADCPGSECSRTLTGGVKFCDVPAVKTCNPVTGLAPTNCPGSAQGCYVSATVPDETRCDCPFADVHEGGDCTVSRDCLPGLVCADPNGQNHFICERACKLTGTVSGCTAPATCNSIKGSKTFGFCN